MLALGAAPVSAVDPPTCQGEPATIVASGPVTTGTDGPDVIVGTAGADTINALDGDDLVCGAPDGATVDGADTINAGDGNDFVLGVLGDDVINGGNGDDGLAGGDFGGEPGNPGSKLPDGNDTLSGGNGDDILDGDNVDGDNPAPDPIPNSDTCAGGSGANQLFFCEIQS
jgi:Ca2+-binding RTX toxin-like protein